MKVIDGIVYLDKVTLGYIPLGSGNDFARGLGLPTDIHGAWEQILAPTHYTAMNVGGYFDYENKHRRLRCKYRNWLRCCSLSSGDGHTA